MSRHDPAQGDTRTMLDDESLRGLLQTPQGRRFLSELIEDRCALSGVVCSGEQTHLAAYLEGRRSIGVELSADCQRVDAPNYVRMVGEALERREAARLDGERAKERIAG